MLLLWWQHKVVVCFLWTNFLHQLRKLCLIYIHLFTLWSVMTETWAKSLETSKIIFPSSHCLSINFLPFFLLFYQFNLLYPDIILIVSGCLIFLSKFNNVTALLEIKYLSCLGFSYFLWKTEAVCGFSLSFSCISIFFLYINVFLLLIFYNKCYFI